MLFLSPSSQQKDSDRHCLACGHQGLTAYVKASKTGFGVPEDALDIVFYRCDQCQSINEFSCSQGFYEVEEDKAFANFYLDSAAGIAEMIDPIARFSGLVVRDQQQSEPLRFWNWAADLVLFLTIPLKCWVGSPMGSSLAVMGVSVRVSWA